MPKCPVRKCPCALERIFSLNVVATTTLNGVGGWLIIVSTLHHLEQSSHWTFCKQPEPYFCFPVEPCLVSTVIITRSVVTTESGF